MKIVPVLKLAYVSLTLMTENCIISDTGDTEHGLARKKKKKREKKTAPEILHNGFPASDRGQLTTKRPQDHWLLFRERVT